MKIEVVIDVLKSFTSFQILSGFQAISGAISIGFSYLYLAKYLGEASVGYLAFIFAYFTILKTLDPVVTIGISRFIVFSKNNEDSDLNYTEIGKIVDSGFFASTAVAACIALLGFVILYGFTSPPNQETSFKTLIILSATYFWFLSIANQSCDVFDGLQKSSIRSILNICGYLIPPLGTLILVPSYGLIGFVFVLNVHQAFLFVGSRFFLAIQSSDLYILPRLTNLSINKIKELTKFGFKVQIGGLIYNGGEPMVKLFIGHQGDLNLLGVLELCLKVIMSIRNVVTGLFSPLMPIIADYFSLNKIKELKGFLKLNYKKLIAANLIMFIGCLQAIILLPEILYGRLDDLFIQVGVALSIGFSFNSFGILAFQIGAAKNIFIWNYITQLVIVIFCIIGMGVSIIMNDNLFIILMFSSGLFISGFVSIYGGTQVLKRAKLF